MKKTNDKVLNEIFESIDVYMKQGVTKSCIIDYICALEEEITDDQINSLLDYLEMKLEKSLDDITPALIESLEDEVESEDEIFDLKGSVDSNIRNYLRKISQYSLLTKEEELKYSKIVLEKEDYDELEDKIQMDLFFWSRPLRTTFFCSFFAI